MACPMHGHPSLVIIRHMDIIVIIIIIIMSLAKCKICNRQQMY